MPPNKEYCSTHEANMLRYIHIEADMKRQEVLITELFEKYNEVRDDYAEIKGTLGEISASSRSLLAKLTGLCDAFNKHKDEESKHDDVLEQAILEINKFAWFRNRMNALRDNLPTFILWILLGTIGLLVIVSEIKLSDWVKKVFG